MRTFISFTIFFLVNHFALLKGTEMGFYIILGGIAICLCLYQDIVEMARK